MEIVIMQSTPKKQAKIVARALAVASLAWLATSSLTACNTTEGVGKDIKAAGEGIEDTAKDAKD